MQLHELNKSPGRTKSGKKKGRGNSSGSGNYSGKGLKGQKSRSGGGVSPWFEGGQTPLYRRLPKLRGFKRYFKLLDTYQPVNIGQLETDDRIASGSTVDKALLAQCGYIRKASSLVKILGNGDLTKTLTFDGLDAISASALALVEKAGGSFINAPIKEEKEATSE